MHRHQRAFTISTTTSLDNNNSSSNKDTTVGNDDDGGNDGKLGLEMHLIAGMFFLITLFSY